MRTIILLTLFTLSLSILIQAQSEILTNAEIIEMAQAGLGKDLILQKIKISGNNYDISTKGLIELKKGQVDDEIITLLVEKSKNRSEKLQTIRTSENSIPEKKALTAFEALRSARTMAIHKSSLNPSRQALEKELVRRPEWQKLNLTITEDKETADICVQIGFVPLSLLTHRYVYRVYDRGSGILIAAGETTSWGSLTENLARNITKSLDKVLETK